MLQCDATSVWRMTIHTLPFMCTFGPAVRRAATTNFLEGDAVPSYHAIVRACGGAAVVGAFLRRATATVRELRLCVGGLVRVETNLLTVLVDRNLNASYRHLRSLVLREEDQMYAGGLGMAHLTFLSSIAELAGPALEELDVEGMRGSLPRHLSAKVPNLRRLNVRGTHSLPEDLLAPVRCFENLTHLNICQSQCHAADEGLVAVATKCLLLSWLDVSETRGSVTDRGVMAVARGCPYLRHLACGNTCKKVTDASIECIIAHCPVFTSLDASRSAGAITEPVLTRLVEVAAARCEEEVRGMRCIGVSCVPGLSNKFLETVLNLCGPTLRELSIAKQPDMLIPMITGRARENRLPALRLLDIQSNKIYVADLQALQQALRFHPCKVLFTAVSVVNVRGENIHTLA